MSDTHSHSAGNLHPGTYGDQVDRADAGMGAGGIGQPFKAFGAFTPMMHTAPITQMTHHHDTIACPGCGAGILWDGSPVLFNCQGCGVTVDGKALAGQ